MRKASFFIRGTKIQILFGIPYISVVKKIYSFFSATDSAAPWNNFTAQWNNSIAHWIKFTAHWIKFVAQANNKGLFLFRSCGIACFSFFAFHFPLICITFAADARVVPIWIGADAVGLRVVGTDREGRLGAAFRW
jgi:hypothetical protein